MTLEAQKYCFVSKPRKSTRGPGAVCQRDAASLVAEVAEAVSSTEDIGDILALVPAPLDSFDALTKDKDAAANSF